MSPVLNLKLTSRRFRIENVYGVYLYNPVFYMFAVGLYKLSLL